MKTGNIEMLKLLLQHGADLKPWYRMVGDIHMRLLHVACKSSNAEIVELIISNEANPKAAINELVKGTNSSVMHLAAQGGSLEVLNVLFKYKADLCLINDARDTPLHVSIRHGHEDFSLALITKLV